MDEAVLRWLQYHEGAVLAILRLNHEWHHVVQRKRGEQRLLYGKLRSGERASSVTGTSHFSDSQHRQTVVSGDRRTIRLLTSWV